MRQWPRSQGGRGRDGAQEGVDGMAANPKVSRRAGHTRALEFLVDPGATFGTEVPRVPVTRVPDGPGGAPVAGVEIELEGYLAHDLAGEMPERSRVRIHADATSAMLLMLNLALTLGPAEERAAMLGRVVDRLSPDARLELVFALLDRTPVCVEAGAIAY